MADDLAELGVTLRSMASALGGEARRDALELAGANAVKLMDAAVRSDLGDMSLSGWRHRDPAPIVTEAKVEGSAAVIVPRRRLTGIMQTLTSGRNAYQPGDRRVKGSYVSKRTGERKLRTRKVKGVVGATRGKGTWDDGFDAIERATPDLIEESLYEALKGVVRGG